MEQKFFHVSFIILFWVLIVIRGYYHRQAIKYGGKRDYREKRLIRVILAVPFVYFLIKYMINPDFLGWAVLDIPTWLQWSGLALGVSTIPLTVWVHIHLGINFSSVLHIHEKHTLTTSGPYKWVRHPMYTVLFLHFLAILFLTKNWLMGGIPVIILILVVAGRLKNEEKLMIDTFGDEYRRYMQQTSRFLPGF